MAGRPKKNTVDYFPHYIGTGKKMQFMEAKYGNDGYAVWFKILESLAQATDHYLDLNDEVEAAFLAIKCKVETEVLNAMLSDLAKLGAISKALWEYKIVWSESFMDSIKDAYRKRKSPSLTLPDLCRHLIAENIISDISGLLPLISGNNDSNYTAGNTISSAGNPISSAGKGEIGNKEIEIGNKEIGKGRNSPEIDDDVDAVSNPVTEPKPWQQPTMEEIESELISATAWHGDFGTSLGIKDPADVTKWIEMFFRFLRGTGKTHNSFREAKMHCHSWTRKQLELGKTPDTGVTTIVVELENPNKPPDNSGKWLWLNGKWRDTSLFTNSEKRRHGIA